MKLQGNPDVSLYKIRFLEGALYDLSVLCHN